MSALWTLLALLVSVTVASAETISWDRSPSPDVAGYKVYERTTSASYGTGIDVGKVTTYQPPTLTPGLHYFRVTAYDTAKNESPKSEEVSLIVFPAPDPSLELRLASLEQAMTDTVAALKLVTDRVTSVVEVAVNTSTKTLAAIKYEACKLTTKSTLRDALRRAMGGCP